MNAAPNTSVQRTKSIYEQKMEFVFEESGPAAVVELASGLAHLAGADVLVRIAALLNNKGYPTESLSVLKEVCSIFPKRLDIYELLGKRAKVGISKTGAPVSTNEARIPAVDCEYVTVLGNSFTRAFTKGTRFLPMMLAAGPDLCFLTPELAEATSRIVWNAVRRADPKSVVLLVLGNADANTHAKNFHGTWQAVEDGKLPDHETVIRTGAHRCFDLVEQIRTSTNLNLVLFTSTPMLTDQTKWMLKAFNDELFAYADRVGMPVLDLTAELTDPSTGFVWEHLRVSPDDPHLKHEVVPMIEDGLRKLNCLPATSEPFDWDYVFRFSIDPKIETRIWGEAHMRGANIGQSQKFQLSQLLERAANILIGHLTIASNSSVCIVNGREGLLPLEIPPSFASDIRSIDLQAVKTLMGQRVGRYLGRTDVHFVTAQNLAEAVPDCDFLFLITHEDDDLAQCRTVIAAALTKVRRNVLVLTPHNLAGELSESTDVADVREINLGNRFITGYWGGVRLICVTPATAA